LGKYEERLYTLWEESGAFKPNLNAPKSPFSIILPPPNANGNLLALHKQAAILA
jgi:valyl-tRNA synthetase